LVDLVRSAFDILKIPPLKMVFVYQMAIATQESLPSQSTMEA